MAFGGHSNFISAVCVLPPSDQFPHGLILTGSNDKTILAYDLESPQPKYKLTGHEDTGDDGIVLEFSYSFIFLYYGYYYCFIINVIIIRYKFIAV